MVGIKCPNCDIALPSQDLSDGWCDACGKKVPLFVYEQAGMEAPSEKTLTKIHWDHPQAGPEEKESLPVWQFAAIGVFVVGLAVVIVRALT
jgi:hypothetical protein